jgi:anti-sigma factor ChrR (cupin superfamily)
MGIQFDAQFRYINYQSIGRQMNKFSQQDIRINANFSERVVCSSAELAWTLSPSAGVERKMFERQGGEVARATSIVRYAPHAHFERHVHDHGEEILVLEGVLADEFGSYGPGTYLKNPPGSAHAPSSVPGCTLFVKLRHLAQGDTQQVVRDTAHSPWLAGMVAGLSVMPLSTFETTNTALVRWAPGTRFNPHRHHGGEEIFVIDGVFEDEHGRYPAGTWLRSPHLSVHQPFSTEGCTIFVKTGHLLPAAPTPPSGVGA